MNTVANNKANYTNNDYLKALGARELQIKIGQLSTKHFIQIVTTNHPNFPTSLERTLFLLLSTSLDLMLVHSKARQYGADYTWLSPSLNLYPWRS